MPQQPIDSGKLAPCLLASLGSVLVFSLMTIGKAACIAEDRMEFFERKIRPVLVEHCYQCHSEDPKKRKGDLRLDLRDGWQKGGDSGTPSIVPNNPDASPLMRAMRHADDVSAMPPDKPRLPTAILNDFATWIQMGAPDPREGNAEKRDKAAEWEVEFQHRLDWWSLKPVRREPPPDVQQGEWLRTDVDRFILAKLEATGLSPVHEADPRTLARRLSFAITGLHRFNVHIAA